MTDSFIKRLERYVGRAYVPNTYDCAHLVADVQRDLFGRSIALPGVHPGGAAGQRRVINGMRDELAAKVDEPVDGCAVLLADTDDAGHELLHIGTVAVHKNEAWVLHNSAKLGSAHIHRLQDLIRFGMTFLGWYAWK